MVRIALTVLAAALALGGTAQGLLLGPALGQNAAPDKADAAKETSKPGPPSQRYRFSHSAEGVLRLDNETGQVTLCRPLNGSWVCNPAPEETAVLQAELKRKDAELQKLSAEFAQLKDEVSRAQQAGTAGRKSAADEVARLQTAVAALKEDIAGLTGKIADTAKQSGSQGISQDERQGMVSRLALLEQDNSGLKGALARIEAENAKLAKQITEAGKRPDLDGAIAQAIAANDTLKRDLASASAKIAGLEKQVGDDSARRELNVAVAQAREANDALKRELTMAKEQIAALQKRMSDTSDRNAQQAELNRLTAANKELTDKLASLEMSNAAMRSEIDALKPPVPLPRAEVPADKKDEMKLPSREDMERVGAAMSEAWRKLMDMITQLQKDMMRGKDESPPVRL
jgi:chromosome segregation ATPase